MAKIIFIRRENGIDVEQKGQITLELNIGQSGASAYASYLATTTDDPKLSEAEWSASRSGGHTIVDELGTSYPQRTKLKVINATITDNEAEDTTEITVEGGVKSVSSTDNHIQVDNTDAENPTLSFTLVDNENLVTDDEKAALHAHNNKSALDSVSGVNTGDQDLSGLQPKTDNDLETTAKTVVGAVNEVNLLAKGADQALGFGSYNGMITYVKNIAEGGFKVGQSLLVVTIEVPDIWVSFLETSFSDYTYTTDEQFIADVESNGGALQVGYFKLSFLETKSVDLTNYMTDQEVADAIAAYAAPIAHDHTGDDINPDTVTTNQIVLNGFDRLGNPITVNMLYNTAYGVVEFQYPDGTTIQDGLELWFVAKCQGACRNGYGAQFVSSQGGHIVVKEAVAAELNTQPQLFMGMFTQTAANGEFIKMTWFGSVNDVVTTEYEAQGAAKILYVDMEGTGARGFTTIVPNAPYRKIMAASIQKYSTGGSANGVILVRPTFGTKLSDLDDVDGTDTTIADTDEVIKKDTAGLWKKVTWANVKTLLGNIFAPKENPTFTGTVNTPILQQTVGLYFYQCASLTADTVNDRREYVAGGVKYFQRCTVANATKGGGTWVVDVQIDINKTYFYNNYIDNLNYDRMQFGFDGVYFGLESQAIGSVGLKGLKLTAGASVLINGAGLSVPSYRIEAYQFITDRATGRYGYTNGSSVDVATYRNSAGIIEINNGTSGQFRDLKLRNLESTGIVTAPNLRDKTETGDAHGFVNAPSTGIFTLTNTGASAVFTSLVGAGAFKINGTEFTAREMVLSFTMLTGQNFIYCYLNNGVPTLASNGNTPWDIMDKTKIPVAIISYDGVNAPRVGHEYHKADRNLREHYKQHFNWGAQLVGAGFTTTFGSSANNTFSCGLGTIADEDIEHAIGARTQGQIAYRHTSLNYMIFEAPSTAYCKVVGNAPQYDNNGTVSNIGNTNYGIYWMYATNAKLPVNGEIVFVMGQGVYANVAAAQAAARPTLAGMSVAEWKLLYRVIVRQVSGALLFTQADDLRTSTSGPAISGGVTSLAASQINSNYFGNLQVAEDNSGAYIVTQNDSISGTVTLLPNKVINMRNQLTGNLTLALDTANRTSVGTNEYMIEISMGLLQTITYPSAVIRWAYGQAPIITANSNIFLSLLEKLVLTTNIWTGSDIVTTSTKQKYTLSAESNGNIVVKEALAGTMSRATTTVTGVGTAFSADMVGSTLYINGVSQGTVTAWTSATVVTVSGSGTTASNSGDIRRTLTSTGVRSELTFTPNAASATLNFTNTGMTNIQFEAREFATTYVNGSTPTQTTTYLGRVIIN